MECPLLVKRGLRVCVFVDMCSYISIYQAYL